MKKILVAYYSLGGNTETLALLLHQELNLLGEEVTLLPLTKDTSFDSVDIEQYKFVFLGTPTYKQGNTPHIVLSFLRYILKQNEFNLPDFACFGTGDSQWGSLYCRAVDEIEYHLSKRTKVVNKLKIEQRPVSNKQINKIKQYTLDTLRRIQIVRTESKTTSNTIIDT